MKNPNSLTYLPTLLKQFLQGNIRHWRAKDALLGATVPAYLDKVVCLISQFEPLDKSAWRTNEQMVLYLQQWKALANHAFHQYQGDIHRVALEIGNIQTPAPHIDVISPVHESMQFELRVWYRGEHAFGVLEEVGYRDNLVACIPSCSPEKGQELAIAAFSQHPHAPLGEVFSYPHHLYFTHDCGLEGNFIAQWAQYKDASKGTVNTQLLPALEIERCFRRWQET